MDLFIKNVTNSNNIELQPYFKPYLIYFKETTIKNIKLNLFLDILIRTLILLIGLSIQTPQRLDITINSHQAISNFQPKIHKHPILHISTILTTFYKSIQLYPMVLESLLFIFHQQLF